jgi:hypothetical protein
MSAQYDDGRPPLPLETVAYDKGFLDGYAAAKRDYSPGGMYFYLASQKMPWVCRPCTVGRHSDCKGTVGQDSCACIEGSK